MKETIDHMHERHKREVEELQKRCRHPGEQRSGWMPHYWAPAHLSGYEVRVCKQCGSTIAKRANCTRCKKIVEDPIMGDGKNAPYGEYFCSECANLMNIKKTDDR